MPAKITKPLMEGLPSKIYLCAFPAPKSRYQIAREIYNIPKGQIPPTAKVSNVVRDMLSEKYGTKYLIKTPEESILSDVAPLVAEMEKELIKDAVSAQVQSGKELTDIQSFIQSIKLTQKQKTELTAFLDKDFRPFISKHKKKLLDEGDVSAYYVLTDIIGLIVHYKKFLLSIADIKEYKELMAIAFLEGDMEIMEDINKMQLSNSLIEKLEFFVPDELLEISKISEAIVKGFIRIAEHAEKKKQHA